jgi:hypothetical protein
MTDAIDASGSFEESRLAAKAARSADAVAHPFGRHLPPAPSESFFDDQADSDTVLVTIAGAAGKLDIPAVAFFDQVDLPVRRIFIRNLHLYDPGHPLGDSFDERLSALRELLADCPRRIFVGVSIGGFHALLLGSLLDAEAIVAVGPTTTVRPEARAALGDDRPVEAEYAPPEIIDEYSDIPTVWQQFAPKRVIVHFAYRDDIARMHAEHLAGFEQVSLIPHDEFNVMFKIASDGTLRRTLHELLDDETAPERSAVSTSERR